MPRAMTLTIACLLALIFGGSCQNSRSQVVHVPYGGGGGGSTPTCVPTSVPTALTQTGQGTTSVTITWAAPLTAPCAVAQYQVSTSTDNVTYSLFASYSASTFTSTITGLTSGTTYFVQVVAVNSAGKSPGAVIQASTSAAPAQTPNIPGYVSGTFPSGQAPTSTSGASGSLSWGISWLVSPVDGTHDAAVSYTISLTGGATLSFSPSASQANCSDPGATTCTYVLTGLTASTAYAVKVAGCNFASTPCSSQTPALNITTLSTPANVTNLGLYTPDPYLDSICCNPMGFRLGWTQVSGAVAYLVEYSVDALTWWRTATNPPNTPCVVGGNQICYNTVQNPLEPFVGNTFYLFRVSWCLNASCSTGFTGGTSSNCTTYTGLPTICTSFVIPPYSGNTPVTGYFGSYTFTAPPAPITSVTATAGTTAQITVSWPPPPYPPVLTVPATYDPTLTTSSVPLGYSIQYADQATPNTKVSVINCSLIAQTNTVAAHATNGCSTLGPSATAPVTTSYTLKSTDGIQSGHTYIVYVNAFNCATSLPQVVPQGQIGNQCDQGTGAQVGSNPVTAN